MKKYNLPKVGQRIRYKVGEDSTKVAIVSNIYPGSVYQIEVNRRGIKGAIKLDEVVQEPIARVNPGAVEKGEIN